MKKVTVIKTVTLFLGALLLTASLFQCKKVGDVISNLDRSFTGAADTSVYASFYENNKVIHADNPADVNDIMKFRGVQTIIHEYCGTSNCHGGPIKPKFDTYSEIMKYVVAGSPELSSLWEYITTNDFDKAMPPVNSNHEMNTRDKSILYNWIKNGAREYPTLADFRPAAIRIIVDGCGSANCHNQATVGGSWARMGLLGPLATSDTVPFTNPLSGTAYNQLVNVAKRNEAWGVHEFPISTPYSYKDSIKLFYTDTVANGNFRPFKTFTTPWSDASRRGPLNTYDDIVMDILYPKSIRSLSSSSTFFVDGIRRYVRGNYLNSSDCFIRRIDSTVIYHNVFTGVATTPSGNMSWDDGGLKPNEIALIKAWYFNDPNIPDVWKYGINNAGIFKYRKTGNFIRK